MSDPVAIERRDDALSTIVGTGDHVWRGGFCPKCETWVPQLRGHVGGCHGNPARRFWSHVDRFNDPGGCWPFTGEHDRDGYGRLLVRGQRIRAHRFAWHLTHGDPGDLLVLHRCDNPPCCNPAHLFTGDHALNQADAAVKGRARQGEANGRAKLTEGDVRAIRTRLDAGETTREIAAAFGVSSHLVSLVGRRKVWAHV